MAKPKDFKALIDLTKTTQTLLVHYQSSLAPTTKTTETQPTTTQNLDQLGAIKAATTLLKSHTTTLSLILINPPLTPSAIITKIGDVSSGVLGGIVAAAAYTPPAGQTDQVGNILRTELKARVRRLLGTWGEVLAIVLRIAEKEQKTPGAGVSESEKQEVLSTTGVVWDACDVLLKLCTDGVVGLVVKKAEELRAVLLDAIEELKEWGEDIDDDDDEAEGSDEDGFKDEDDFFSASNKLGKDDKELKALLDTSVKKLKMVGMLYQALIKRRLKTYPAPTSAAIETAPNSANGTTPNPSKKLDDLMAALKTIPETVDDLASAFYDLDEDEAKDTLDKCWEEAKSAIAIVKQNWAGTDDEFTAWSAKWESALDAA